MKPAAWRWVLAAAVVVHLVVLYWPSPPGVAGGFEGLDKVVHAAVFAAVAVAGRRAGLPLLLLVGVLAAHAVVSEVLQHAVLPGRSGDPWDVAADLAGIAAGVLLASPRRARTPARAGR